MGVTHYSKIFLLLVREWRAYPLISERWLVSMASYEQYNIMPSLPFRQSPNVSRMQENASFKNFRRNSTGSQSRLIFLHSIHTWALSTCKGKDGTMLRCSRRLINTVTAPLWHISAILAPINAMTYLLNRTDDCVAELDCDMYLNKHCVL